MGYLLAIRARRLILRESPFIFAPVQLRSGRELMVWNRYSSMAVTMAGDKFTERHEQEALMNVLNICDKTQGWPTGHAQENLKDAWGWTESV